jgi:hypothetical protein
VNEERKIAVEEVDAVTAPPKARVDDVTDVVETFERKRDYLSGFLSQKPESHPGASPAASSMNP